MTEQRHYAETSNEEWRGYFENLSNWGRWGPDDQRGTLNLINGAKVAAAASLVSEGRQVSCGRLVEFGNRVSVYEAADAPLHFLSSTGARLNADGAGGGTDWVGFQIHGLYMTHLDAPSHQFWNGSMYNGHPAENLTAESGARVGSVELAGSGIIREASCLTWPRSSAWKHSRRVTRSSPMSSMPRPPSTGCSPRPETSCSSAPDMGRLGVAIAGGLHSWRLPLGIPIRTPCHIFPGLRHRPFRGSAPTTRPLSGPTRGLRPVHRPMSGSPRFMLWRCVPWACGFWTILSSRSSLACAESLVAGRS